MPTQQLPQPEAQLHGAAAIIDDPARRIMKRMVPFLMFLGMAFALMTPTVYADGDDDCDGGFIQRADNAGIEGMGAHFDKIMIGKFNKISSTELTLLCLNEKQRVYKISPDTRMFDAECRAIPWDAFKPGEEIHVRAAIRDAKAKYVQKGGFKFDESFTAAECG